MILKDKVAVVTGGAQGIGKAIVEDLLKQGAKVVIANRNIELGESVTKELSEIYGENVYFIKTDVSVFEDVSKAVDFAVEKFGTLDIMISNAGTAIASPLLDIDMEKHFAPVINVNINGTAHGMISAGRKMRDLGVKGVILNVSSVFGEMAQPNLLSYNASKSAILMMTKSGAMDLAQYGIRVVAIQPGAVETDILKRLRLVQPEIDKTIKITHLRRETVTLEEIAQTVSFLVSDNANGINGVSVPIDDGFTTYKIN